MLCIGSGHCGSEHPNRQRHYRCESHKLLLLEDDFYTEDAIEKRGAAYSIQSLGPSFLPGRMFGNARHYAEGQILEGGIVIERIP